MTSKQGTTAVVVGGLLLAGAAFGVWAKAQTAAPAPAKTAAQAGAQGAPKAAAKSPAKASAPATTAAATTTWTIDWKQTQVNFQVRHLGVSYVRGSLSGVNGTVTWNPADPSKSGVMATIDATTVNTAEDARDKDLKSDRFFGIDKFPKLSFQSTSVSGRPGKLKIIGNLTMIGVTRPVTLMVDGPTEPVKSQDGSTVIGFSASGALKRSDFGFGSQTQPPVVGDQVTFTIDVEAKKQ